MKIEKQKLKNRQKWPHRASGVNFCSRQTQAGIQVSSVILFCVSLFNRFIIEKALSQITSMERIFNAVS